MAELSEIRISESNETVEWCEGLFQVKRIHCDCLCDSKYDVIKPFADFCATFDTTFCRVSGYMLDVLWNAIQDLREEHDYGNYTDGSISATITKLYGGFNIMIEIITKL